MVLAEAQQALAHATCPVMGAFCPSQDAATRTSELAPADTIQASTLIPLALL